MNNKNSANGILDENRQAEIFIKEHLVREKRKLIINLVVFLLASLATISLFAIDPSMNMLSHRIILVVLVPIIITFCYKAWLSQ